MTNDDEIEKVSTTSIIIIPYPFINLTMIASHNTYIINFFLNILILYFFQSLFYNVYYFLLLT